MVNETPRLTSQTTSDDRPKLVSIVALDGRDDSALLELAASVAHGLESHLAVAIVESAQEREVELRPVEQFDHVDAQGVVAAVDGHTVVLGNAALFRHFRLSSESLGDWSARLQRRGEHVLLLAVDGRTAGFLGIAGAPTCNRHTHVDAMEDEDARRTVDRRSVSDRGRSASAEPTS